MIYDISMTPADAETIMPAELYAETISVA